MAFTNLNKVMEIQEYLEEKDLTITEINELINFLINKKTKAKKIRRQNGNKNNWTNYYR